jgi:hypothetical protein
LLRLSALYERLIFVDRILKRSENVDVHTSLQTWAHNLFEV